MSRDIPTDMVTAAESDTFPPALFVELHWSSGTVYAWAGYGDYTWGGHTWLGTGHLGKIGDVAEGSDNAANGLALQISGVPSANIAEAMTDDSQGLPGRVYLGALQSVGTLVSTPICIYDGLINYTVIEDDGQSATITVQLDKELMTSNSEPRRYTHQDQQIDYPGDMFFAYLAGNIGRDFGWGRQPSYGNGGVQPGSGLREPLD